MTHTTDLQALITRTLGVSPQASPVALPTTTKKVPARPEAMYEYRVTFTKYTTGSIVVTATSEDDARFKSNEYSEEEIDWDDYDDVDINDTSLESQHVVNLEDLNEWDTQYGKLYDNDGDPKCTNCEDNYDEEDLHLNEDEDEWICDVCLGNLQY